ncbi:MAG: twitching motility protein PilT [Alphaproteobacteria bacterium 41-28]|nr:MAG: twitching motility protein PilT [Alphaproteobacteria bacterium 41-28]
MFLLDTHVLLWWLADDPSLSPKARVLISDEKALVFVSAASAWEIVVKKALGKLEAPDDLEIALKENNFKELPITIRHALAIGHLPNYHQDPFDHMLVAQAQCESLTLITADKKLLQYDIAYVKT